MTAFDMRGNHPSVEVFIVLDLDRTLFNTDKWVEAVFDSLASDGASAKTIDAAKDDIERLSLLQSVDFVEHIKNIFGERQAGTALQTVEVICTNDRKVAAKLIYDGAEQTIDVLERTNTPFGIITYGSVEAQEYKLRILRAYLNKSMLKAHVTHKLRKAEVIASEWKVGSRPGYVVDADLTDGFMTARTIVIVDDKPSNLETDDMNIKGVLIDNSQSVRTYGISDHSPLSLLEFSRHLSDGGDIRRIAKHFPMIDIA